MALGPEPAAKPAIVKLRRLGGAAAGLAGARVSDPASPDARALKGRLHWGAAASEKRNDQTLERLLDLDRSESDMASTGGFADIDLGGVGGLLLGFVQNRWMEEQGLAAAGETVLSGGADFRFHVGGTPLSVASELAFYNVDHDGEADGVDVATSNLGYSFKLGNPQTAGPVGYGFLFEYYGTGFRPHGRRVKPDQMRLRFDGSWRTAGGFKLSGYAGRVVAGFGDDAQTEKWRGGLEIGRKLDIGVLDALDIKLGLDLDRHSRQDEGLTSHSRGVRLGLSAPLVVGLRGRIKLHAKQVDEVADDLLKTVSGLDAGFDRDLRLFGFGGRASAGVIVRSTVRDDESILEQGGRFEASLGRGRDRIGLRGSLLSRSAEDHRLGRKLALRWSRDAGDYSIGFEAEHRHGVGDDDEAAYLAGMFVTATF